MINTKELMLGNLLFLRYYDEEGKEQKTIVEVESIGLRSVNFKPTHYRTSASPEELEPIPLYYHQLWPYKDKRYPDEIIKVRTTELGEGVQITYDDGRFYHSLIWGEYDIFEIDSVHQVQNLLNTYKDFSESQEFKSKVLDWWNKSQK